MTDFKAVVAAMRSGKRQEEPEGAGWYYLHENGDLIFKRTEPEQDAGGFVRKVWPVRPQDRGSAWIVLIEGLALGAKKERVAELAAKWGCDDADAPVFAERAGLRVTRDGNQWMAAFADFVNIQESQCAFGATALEAMAELARPELTRAA
ncbi:MAG: hypothetical protein Q8S13_01610 [Dehalococcoidia bacterium]|nr:hypothetical protein [Dehalococcoidia bacterium]